MHFKPSALLSALLVLGAASLTSVSAETFVVMVGQDGALAYDPPSITAKDGDSVAFRFMSKNHTVSQSTFAKPCERKAGGADSGFQAVAAGATAFPQWTITLNDTVPLWFFCAQAPHCQRGMVFAINPSADQTFDAFKAAALASGTGNTTTTTTTSGSGTAAATTAISTGTASVSVSVTGTGTRLSTGTNTVIATATATVSTSGTAAPAGQSSSAASPGGLRGASVTSAQRAGAVIVALGSVVLGALVL